VAGIDSLKHDGKNEISIGPVRLGNNGIDIVVGFGGQAVLGAGLEISGKEAFEFISTIGKLQYEYQRK
jgi:hypothetical protein